MSNTYTLDVTETTDFTHATLNDNYTDREEFVPLEGNAPDDGLALLREVVEAVNDDKPNGNLVQTAALLDALDEYAADLTIRGSTYTYQQIKGVLALRQSA